MKVYRKPKNTVTIACSILPDKKQKSGMFKSSIAISPWSIAADFELQTKSLNGYMQVSGHI
jgi:hypothetical protein